MSYEYQQSVFEPERWGLSTGSTQNLAQRLFGFWQRFQVLLKTKTRDTSEYAYCYMSGQLRMEERRNFANIGCNTGVSEQNMQHFMSNSPWSAQAVIRQVQVEIAATPGLGPGGVLILDESANKKAGDKSAGSGPSGTDYSCPLVRYTDKNRVGGTVRSRSSSVATVRGGRATSVVHIERTSSVACRHTATTANAC